jgi:general secretion pathway protein D
LIRATEQQWRELQGYIDQFDIVPKQVTIKVQFVTTSSSNTRSLGFEWLYTRGTQSVGNTPGSFARSSDPIFLSWQTGNIQARLRTFLQDGYGSTVSSPVVRTLNNQPASVVQALQTVIFVPTTFNNGQISTTVYTPIALTAASQLVVRPRINEDGTVTMALNMPIQQFGQIRRSPDGSVAVPDVSTQQIQIVARVRSGETIVLAGFTQKNDTFTQQKFPVLGDLPVIGQFFRSTSKDTNSTELLVFVTPVIEDPETSGGFGG